MGVRRDARAWVRSRRVVMRNPTAAANIVVVVAAAALGACAFGAPAPASFASRAIRVRPRRPDVDGPDLALGETPHRELLEVGVFGFAQSAPALLAQVGAGSSTAGAPTSSRPDHARNSRGP